MMRFAIALAVSFSNFGSLKSTETFAQFGEVAVGVGFSNFGSLKSTETECPVSDKALAVDFSNFGSLKSTETDGRDRAGAGDGVSAISAR